MSEQLKPCPFCGASEGRLFVEQDEIGWFYVICATSDYGCGATGPAGINEDEAIKMWNRRSDP